MEYLQAIVLGIVQGITEFVPISSSGHLVLVRELFKWEDPGLFFDSILHLGTVLGLLIYFRRTWLKLLKALSAMLKTGKLYDSPTKRLFWHLLVATIPAGVVGFLFRDVVEEVFRAGIWVALLMIAVGIFMIMVERVFDPQKPLKKMKWWQGLLVGIAQIFALLPGVSRSGVTMLTGMVTKLQRKDAARFSFLLSLPILTGAGLVGINDYAADTGDEISVTIGTLILGFVVSTVVSWLAIRFFMRFIKKHKLDIFGLYLVLIGLVVLALTYNLS